MQAPVCVAGNANATHFTHPVHERLRFQACSYALLRDRQHNPSCFGSLSQSPSISIKFGDCDEFRCIKAAVCPPRQHDLNTQSFSFAVHSLWMMGRWQAGLEAEALA